MNNLKRHYFMLGTKGGGNNLLVIKVLKFYYNFSLALEKLCRLVTSWRDARWKESIKKHLQNLRKITRFAIIKESLEMLAI